MGARQILWSLFPIAYLARLHLYRMLEPPARGRECIPQTGNPLRQWVRVKGTEQGAWASVDGV